MKKTITLIASICLTALLSLANNDELTEAGNQTYVPEDCSSSVSCMTHYSTEKTPFTNRVYCCSENTPNKTGKAKA